MAKKVFNTEFEMSLRILLLLNTVSRKITLERLMAYDFMTIYSEEFGLGFAPLHGANEFAFSEIVINRNLMKAAIKPLVLDGLINVNENEQGITYGIADLGKKTAVRFISEYAKKYCEILVEVDQIYRIYSDKNLFEEIQQKAINLLRRGEQWQDFILVRL